MSARGEIALLKQAQEELLRAKEAADAASRAKSEFLSSMSHEIRTPLNAMLGLAQVGARKSRGRQIARTFDQILHSGGLLLKLINDILDLSKIEAGKLHLESLSFALGEAIDHAVDVSAPLAYAKGLDVFVNEAVDLPVRCVGDPVRLSQVLSNLLSNAVKFTTCGSVRLDVGREEDALLFRIADTGIGMAPDFIARLFQPFEQGDGSIARKHGGTGLGLVISRHLVELMGGDIRVDSRPGAGTVMEVRLPLAEEVAATVHGESASFHLAGLPQNEVDAVVLPLAAHGIATRVHAPDEAFLGKGEAWCVADASLVEACPGAARALLKRGQRLAVVCTPGVGSLPDDIAVAAVQLDRPLRWRHLLAVRSGALIPHNRHPAEAGPRLAGLRILAADDDAANRLVMREILDQHGAAAAVVVDNGMAVCNRLVLDGPGAYDAVVTDIQMPVMDGYETARRIRELAPDLPVIGLSGHALPEVQGLCRAAGMVDLLVKPVDIDRLAAVILHHLPAGTLRPAEEVPAPLPAQSGLPASGAVVDWTGLEERFKSKPEFVDALASTVLDSHAGLPEQLRAALAVGDHGELAGLSHRIRGMAGNLLAAQLFDLARRAEDAARSQSPETVGLAGELAAALDAVLAVLAERAVRRA